MEGRKEGHVVSYLLSDNDDSEECAAVHLAERFEVASNILPAGKIMIYGVPRKLSKLLNK